MNRMKRNIALMLVAATLAAAGNCAFGLSLSLPEPQIFFPQGYDTNRANQVLSVLRSDKFKYLGGLTSYWEPDFYTTLVYEGDGRALTAFLAALNEVKGMSVRLTFSSDLSKETGSALQAGSWWVIYSHTMPDTITVRINLAAQSFGGDKFELRLPKPKP
jgi:hypothetical protein